MYPKLLDEVRQVLRLQHDSIHTERSYLDWVANDSIGSGSGPFSTRSRSREPLTIYGEVG